MIAIGRTFRRFVLALSFLTAAGCGYQLRGTISLPSEFDDVYVTGPSDVSIALTREFESGDIRVQSNRDSAKAVVRLGNEQFDQRVLSVNPTTGKESEFELSYQITFEVIDGSGETLMPSQTVSLLRDYVFDPGAALGKSREQSVIRAEMHREAAERIVRRIQATLGS